jgi:hypothetical protein
LLRPLREFHRWADLTRPPLAWLRVAGAAGLTPTPRRHPLPRASGSAARLRRNPTRRPHTPPPHALPTCAGPHGWAAHAAAATRFTPPPCLHQACSGMCGQRPHLPGLLAEAADQRVPVGAGGGALIVVLHNDGLLAGVLAGQKDHHLLGLGAGPAAGARAWFGSWPGGGCASGGRRAAGRRERRRCRARRIASPAAQWRPPGPSSVQCASLHCQEERLLCAACPRASAGRANQRPPATRHRLHIAWDIA